MPANMRGSIPTTFNGAVQMFSSDFALHCTFCPHPHEEGIFPGFNNESFDSGKVVVLDMPLRRFPEAGRVMATERHYETWFSGERAQVLSYTDTITEPV
jgi:hypothetical protein